MTVEQTAAAAPGASVTVTATAKPGFVFAGGAPTYSESHNFPAAADCTVVTPPTPTPTVIVEPPIATPTVVHAGLVSDAADNTRSEQGIALLASGLLLMVAAGGLARPRTARR